MMTHGHKGSTDATTDAPVAKSKRNIRTLKANRMQYLLANYPADVELKIAYFIEGLGNFTHGWSEARVLRAMKAAYDAGRRSGKEALDAYKMQRRNR